MNHQNILLLLGASQSDALDGHDLALIYERAHFGTLYQILSGTVTLKLILGFLLQLKVKYLGAYCGSQTFC